MTALRWSTSLSAAEQSAVRGLIADADAADGVCPVGDQVLRDLSGARSQHLLAGDLEGYLYLPPARDGEDPTAEAVVHPGARRRGLGSRLVRAALDRGSGGVRFWAHATLPAAQATARALDLIPVRELLQMVRPLALAEPQAEGVAPQGITVRRYRGRDDDAGLLRVNNAAFAWHPEQGGWTDGDLAVRMAEPWFEPAGLLVAVDDSTGDLLGFHWTKVHDEQTGEVYVLAVDPAAQGRGLGRTLTLAGLDHLARRLAGTSSPRAILYVERDNAAAVATYRGLGFTVSRTDTAYAPR